MDHRYEPEIDLRNLIFYILYKWRLILSSALLFAILLGGFAYVRDTIRLRKGIQPKKLIEYEIALAEYQLTQTTHMQNIEEYQKRLEQQQTYMEQSVLMQVDPYKKPTATADIFIKLDEAEWNILPDNINLDPTDSLIRLYTSNFLSTIDWKPIERLTGKDAIYLKELLSVGTDYNSNTFTVGIVYNDGEMAENILDIVISQIEERSKNTELSKHSISVMNRSLSYAIDNTLANLQKSNTDALTNYTQAILDCRKHLEELEEPDAPSQLGFLKYTLIGFIIGAFALSVLYGVLYILDGKLHNAAELQTQYGCRLIGVFPKPVKKRFLRNIDNLLIRIGEDLEALTDEEIYRFISLNIAAIAGQYKKILVTGTIDRLRLENIVAVIAPTLESITLTPSPNMNRNADTLNILADCDAVILIEERHISSVSEIHKELESIFAFNKPIGGYILT